MYPNTTESLQQTVVFPLRVVLTGALEAILREESPANRHSMFVALDRFVDARKAAGASVEQVIVDCKGIARECHDAPSSERILQELVHRVVLRYFLAAVES
ncbi:MAG TPA: hypothetical protein VJ867_07755 [Gemmatimonadaceae bacterium]|nr:hypothetical protein [Gemmatimonadaceae bacterium]